VSVESLTVGKVAGMVFQRIANTTTVASNLTSTIKFAINAGIRELVCDTCHGAFRTEATISAVVSTADYALPADFYKLIPFTLRHTTSPYEPLIFLKQQDYEFCFGPTAFATAARPRNYGIRGANASTGLWQLRLFPTPVRDYTLNYWYHAIPSNCSEAADGTEIDPRFPREYGHYIVEAALAHLPSFLSSEELTVSRGLVEEGKKRLMSSVYPMDAPYEQKGRYPINQGVNRQIAWPGSISTGESSHW